MADWGDTSASTGVTASWNSGGAEASTGSSWNTGGSDANTGNSGGFGNDGGFGDGGDLGASLQDYDYATNTVSDFKRNFYREDQTVANRSDAEVQEIRDHHQIKVFGKNVPKPVKTFAEAGFTGDIQSIIDKAGFVHPTAIQAQGFPAALSGRNVVGVAATGSGKTLSFLLPAALHIRAQAASTAGDGPVALVVTPTRELALQIQAESEKFVETGFGISSVCVYGGQGNRRNQASRLESGVDIVIATPGRLIDFLEKRTTNLRRVTYLVLDEADRMLDMGFMPQIRKIVGQIRPDRQVLMWSATWPREVEALARDFIQDFVKITVGNEDLKACHDIQQDFVFDLRGMRAKMQALMTIMGQLRSQHGRLPSVLVFASTKRGVDEVCCDLSREGIPVAGLHGTKSQTERDSAIRAFKSGDAQVLVATDIAQRGLDIKNLDYVINFDMPNNGEDYVHRIGRTGRAGRKGTAITFVSDDKPGTLGQIMKVVREAGQTPPEAMVSMAGSGGSDRMGGNQYAKSWMREAPRSVGGFARRDRDSGFGGRDGGSSGGWGGNSRGSRDGGSAGGSGGWGGNSGGSRDGGSGGWGGNSGGSRDGGSGWGGSSGAGASTGSWDKPAASSGSGTASGGSGWD